MKRRQLLIVLIVLLIAVAGVGGTLGVRALLLKPKDTVHASVALYTTGTRVIPTVKVSTSTANCDPAHIPGVASRPARGMGAPAIKPHLCSIPTFTAQDVRQYMHTVSRFAGMRIEQVSAHYTVTRILFVTNQVANDILNADTGATDNNLIVCYVEVYGDFTVAAPFSSPGTKPKLLHHGQMVFDGVTGNMLVMGVVP
ncbi:MAG: hypothetical protein H0W02_05160 [Ktedonobacteraceae bacterium]|nr:hypothetical protein [Ktedonobacteraceae bacterium]